MSNKRRRRTQGNKPRPLDDQNKKGESLPKEKGAKLIQRATGKLFRKSPKQSPSERPRDPRSFRRGDR